MRSTRTWIAILLVSSVASHAVAELTVDDKWTQAGQVTVTGSGWSARVDKTHAALVLTSNDQTVEIVPIGPDGEEPDAVTECKTSQDAADQAVVSAVFGAGQVRIEAAFHFTPAGTVRIVSGGSVAIQAPVSVGILPGISIEDVLYRPERFAGQEEVHVPAENWFAGLLEGTNGMVACAWPGEGQALVLEPDADTDPPVRFKTIEIAVNGQNLYLEVLAAPAMWRRETFELGYLEKSVPLDWRRPFPAVYKTQLSMRGQTTTVRTFTFLKKTNIQYRPEVGTCVWPVWFQDETPMMRLSKRIPPRGDAIIYPFDEGDHTLMGFLQRTPVADLVVQRNKHALLSRGPRDAANIGFVACGGTGMIRATILAYGAQEREKALLAEYADFLADYVAIVQQRHAGFLTFINDTHGQINTWISAHENDPEVRAYLERMREIADDADDDVRQELELFGENTTEEHMARASRGADRLKELLDTGNAEVFPECDQIVHECNRLSWGQAEDVGMRFSMLAREWAQEAALAASDNPQTLEYARVIRAGARSALNTAPPW